MALIDRPAPVSPGRSCPFPGRVWPNAPASAPTEAGPPEREEERDDVREPVIRLGRNACLLICMCIQMFFPPAAPDLGYVWHGRSGAPRCSSPRPARSPVSLFYPERQTDSHISFFLESLSAKPQSYLIPQTISWYPITPFADTVSPDLTPPNFRSPSSWPVTPRAHLQAPDLPGAVCVGALLRFQFALQVFETVVEEVSLQLGAVPLLAARQQLLLQTGNLEKQDGGQH